MTSQKGRYRGFSPHLPCPIHTYSTNSWPPLKNLGTMIKEWWALRLFVIVILYFHSLEQIFCPYHRDSLLHTNFSDTHHTLYQLYYIFYSTTSNSHLTLTNIFFLFSFSFSFYFFSSLLFFPSLYFFHFSLYSFPFSLLFCLFFLSLSSQRPLDLLLLRG